MSWLTHFLAVQIKNMQKCHIWGSTKPSKWQIQGIHWLTCCYSMEIKMWRRPLPPCGLGLQVRLLFGWWNNTEQIGGDLQAVLFDLSSSRHVCWHSPSQPHRMARAALAWPQPACQLSSPLLLSLSFSLSMPNLFPHGCSLHTLRPILQELN